MGLLIAYSNMRYQNSQDEAASESELVASEAEEHDVIYEGSYPFWGDSLRIDPDNVWNVYDECYKPDAQVSGRRRRKMLEYLQLDTIDGKKVLVVGCGNGQNAVMAALHGAEVHGFDISPAGINRAREIAAANGVSDNCTFTVQSASQIGTPDRHFDIVLASTVLHHVWKYDGVQEELFRVLDDGGHFVFDDGIRSNPAYRFCRSMIRKLTGKTQQLGDVDLTPTDLRQYGERFSETEIEYFTLLNGAKNLIGDEIENPAHIRGLFYITTKLDDIILGHLNVPDRYCLEVVGRFTK